jgi:RNA polymerase sigma-70 factor (ECF subfamily)
MPDSSDDASQALEAVLIKYGRLVSHVGRSHGLTGKDVDELVQEVRIRLWRARATSEKIVRVPPSYLYRTAASAAVDLIRQRRARREERVNADRAGGEAVFGAVPGPSWDLERAELSETIFQAVGHLSDSRRPVVRMYLAGYQRDEIGKLLGWSEAKTRNLLYRGLADLRARLAELGVGPEERG